MSQNYINNKPIDSTIIIKLRAECYNNLDSVKQSVSDFRYLNSENPNDYYFVDAVSQVYIKHKLYNDAQVEIDNLKTDSKTNEVGLVQQAHLAFAQENIQLALTLIDTALKIYPESLRL